MQEPAGRELGLSEELFNATLDATADGIVAISRDGVVQFYNGAFLKIWQIPEALLESRDRNRWFAVALDKVADSAAFEQKVNAFRGQSAPVGTDEVSLKDGRIVEWHVRPQKLGTQFVGRVWTFRDVTSQRRAEWELRESEERFRKLSEASFEGSGIHENGRFILVNENLARMFGYDVIELVGMDILDVVSPETRPLVRKNVGRKEQQSYVVRLLRKDGTKFWGEVRGREAVFQGRPVRMSSMRDITDRILADEQRERLLAQERVARRAAERANKLRDEFLVIASHELRTPLTPLKLSLQVLKKCLAQIPLSASPKTEYLWAALKNMEGSYDRLLRLIEELLDTSAITADRMVLNVEKCDFVAIVKKSVAGFGRQFELAGCVCVLDAPQALIGNWDPARIERLLENLISNAVKFGAGKPIQIRVESIDGLARLAIQD
ncbi:MAG: PAS domain-containing sensor histidine kinase, partial [Bdellovibrionota bacterium]